MYKRILLLIFGMSACFVACDTSTDFFEPLRNSTAPNKMAKQLTYYGAPIANLEFQQYLAYDYTNKVDTGFIALTVENTSSQPVDSLEIVIFLHQDETRASDKLDQAQKEKILLTNLNDTTKVVVFKNISMLKTGNHIEVFCTRYNNQNVWSNYYIGRVESIDTATATLTGINNVYGIVTADEMLDFRLPFSSLETQRIRGNFTTNFSDFIGYGLNDSGDTTAIVSLDTLWRTTTQDVRLLLNYKPKNTADTADQLDFLLFD